MRTGNHLYSGNYSTAGQGVVTIFVSGSCGKTLQSNLYLKHCNSWKKQNTSISDGGNSALAPRKQEERRLGWFSSNILSSMT